MRASSSLSKVLVALGICFMVLAISAMPQNSQACEYACDTTDCHSWSPPYCNAGYCRPGAYGVGCGDCTCKTSAQNPTDCLCKE